jgi:hypothetical protein
MVPVANAQPNVSCTVNSLFTSPFCVYLHPGVNDTYKYGWSHTLDTLWGTQGTGPTPGQPLTNTQTRQVFDSYLDYAILASSSDSIGDLQFDFTIPAGAGNVSRIDIFVPPEFVWLAPTRTEAVWTDITNDYRFISVGTMSEYDAIAPSWTRIRIGQDGLTGGRMNITTGTWHVRLFDLKAPSIAGLYHFKIYAATGAPAATVYASIGVGNYPLIVVKDELNPAWIEVTVRTHVRFGPALGPIISGQVVAEGTTPEGRAVKAWAFWSVNDFVVNNFAPGEEGAFYRCYILGLAEGTYTLTAQGSGMSPTTTDRMTVLAGQSYQARIVIFDSPDVHVTIWSKHGTGAIPWHNLWELPFGTNNPDAVPNNTFRNSIALGGMNSPAFRDILLNLYDAQGNMIGWWASDTVHNVTQQVPWLLGYPQYYAGRQKDLAPPNMLLGYHDDFVTIGAQTYGGTVPTHTNYQTQLTRNCDPRWTWANGNCPAASRDASNDPATHWDGHVPWTWADYIAGMPNGEYTVEAYVTGYVMDEADAYQRTVSLVGTSYALQFDLRRSNWIETTIYDNDWILPAMALSGSTSVTLVAEDTGGNERGSAAFLATNAMSLDGRLNGPDVSLTAAGVYNGGIIIEGWNAIFPDFGMFWAPAIAQDPNLKDYGLNPSPSSHTAGTVTLSGNPYTIKLWMSDMGQPWLRVNGTGWYNIVGGDPQTSVYLCNSPIPLSFTVIPAWLWISIRSTDFEVPAHSRPWTFPGSEVWVDFIAEDGTSAAILDPTLYGLMQDPGTTNASLGWYIPGTNPLIPNFPQHGYGYTPHDIDNTMNATGLYANMAGMHEHIGVHFFGSDWCALSGAWQWQWPLEYAMMGIMRSTRLLPGQYTYNIYTHGYIMRRSFPVMVPFSRGSDIEADVIQGGQIRVWMEFLHEAIRTSFNGFVNVEVFDANDNLVGASIYGQAQPNYFTLLGITPAGGYLNYSRFADHMRVAGPAQGADLALNRTNEAVNTFPSSNGGFLATNTFLTGQRAFFSSLIYSSQRARPIPIHNPLSNAGLNAGQRSSWRFNTWAAYPGFNATASQVANRVNVQLSDANRLIMAAADVAAVDVYGFYWYFGDPVRTWAGGWPTVDGWETHMGFNGGNYWLGTGQWDYGLKGSIDIPGWEGSGGGLYTVKVWAFDSRGANGVYDPGVFSDDWRMYSMGWELVNVQVPWGGAVELWISMNDMAQLRGTVRWFDMFGNLRALPWAQITASPGPGTDTYPAYATGLGAVGFGGSDSAGAYIMWLPAGTHDVSVSTSEAPGAWTSAAPSSNTAYSVVVSPGWVGGSDTQIASSGVPVPELPAFVVPLGLFAALAASAWLLRKRNLNVPILPIK